MSSTTRSGPAVERSALAHLALPLCILVLHVATARGYGYFRDELYYLACGEHLAFGYVDHPPLVALVAQATRALLGSSLHALRLPPAIAAAVTVHLVARIARELGGRRFAQVLAALCAALAPVYLALFTVFSMNAFDVLFWTASSWLLARALRVDASEERTVRESRQRKAWLVLGVVLGLGLENKISVLFLGFGLAVGLVLARRDVLRSRAPWIAAAIAIVLFLPHVAWQATRGWPTLEFMENARLEKNLPLSPRAFLVEQILQMGPPSAIVWISGLVYLLWSRRARGFRAFGWAYLAILGVMLFTHAKPYYLAPAYTVLFAAGAVALEHWTERRNRISVRAIVTAAVIACGVATAPLAKPLVSEDRYVRYAAAIGLEPGTDERQSLGRLPQFFADMHGWRELAECVATVYHALPAEDQAHACIFGQNYGQAGAIDFFGKKLGLPKAISAHNSYWLWGPRDCTGEVVIVIGDRRERLQELFESVELGTTYTCVDCMPYENHKSIWIARKARVPIHQLWPTIKHFI